MKDEPITRKALRALRLWRAVRLVFRASPGAFVWSALLWVVLGVLPPAVDRTVAIKLLPPHLAGDERLRARFEGEAKAVSSLNHPHICTLHDVGHETVGTDELHYLVLEMIEGESLADRLAKGPLPLEEVLRYGIQIASALDAAHKQGIVHRDLKPGNVMITKAGAKLLDFGLAGTGEAAGAGEVVSTLRTLDKPLTEHGTILGTFQYMAPEQLEGQAADARTDIFALGAVLYEMATGRRAFMGQTRTSLIGASGSARRGRRSRVLRWPPSASGSPGGAALRSRRRSSASRSRCPRESAR